MGCSSLNNCGMLSARRSSVIGIIISGRLSVGGFRLTSFLVGVPCPFEDACRALTAAGTGAACGVSAQVGYAVAVNVGRDAFIRLIRRPAQVRTPPASARMLIIKRVIRRVVKRYVLLCSHVPIFDSAIFPSVCPVNAVSVNTRVGQDAINV